MKAWPVLEWGLQEQPRRDLDIIVVCLCFTLFWRTWIWTMLSIACSLQSSVRYCSLLEWFTKALKMCPALYIWSLSLSGNKLFQEVYKGSNVSQFKYHIRLMPFSYISRASNFQVKAETLAWKLSDHSTTALVKNLRARRHIEDHIVGRKNKAEIARSIL